MLKIGYKLPSFSCLDDKGNTVTQDNFKGKKVVLFFIYTVYIYSFVHFIFATCGDHLFNLVCLFLIRCVRNVFCCITIRTPPRSAIQGAIRTINCLDVV